MTREEILKEALRCVTGDREQQYGSPEDSFMAIAELWTVYLEHGCVEDNGAVLLHPEDVAAMMALLKIARICTGKYKGDNWVDLAGYAACGGACQSGSRPMEREPGDAEEHRMKAKIKKLYAYCRPIKKDSDLFNLCRAKAVEDMDEEELDSCLTFFHDVAADRDPSCYSCKHMACGSNKDPCRDCKYLNKYEENTNEQS